MKTIPSQVLEDLKNLAGKNGFRAASPGDVSDARKRYTGNSQHVLRPADTATGAKLIARCSDAGLATIPLGGGTGLVAGHLGLGDRASILFSTERMNRIRQISTQDRNIVAEAGAVLATVQAAAAEQNMLFPLSLAAEGSCTIGGNLATNAGGVQVLRYGNTRDLVLGIEAIMPNGDIMHGLSPLRKNNTGYDIKNLLIGSEGTLGLITAASLKLYPAAQQNATALCPISSPEKALQLLSLLQSELGEFITAFELISGQGLSFLAEHFPQLKQAITPPPPWSVLIEMSGGAKIPLQGLTEEVLGDALVQELILDAIICQSAQQRQQLWDLREHIPLGNAQVGAIVSCDISVPLSALSTFIDRATAKIQALDPALRINCFGHVGDGNLHFNVFPAIGSKRESYRNMGATLRQDIYDLVDQLGGVFSAEHGVGRDKINELQRYGDATRLAVMGCIKKSLDPNNVFNPGAIFPD